MLKSPLVAAAAAATATAATATGATATGATATGNGVGGKGDFFFLRKSPLGAAAAMLAGKDFKKSLKASWQRCYYPHRSTRDASSPVCEIFFKPN